jgi:hypothetical protein
MSQAIVDALQVIQVEMQPRMVPSESRRGSMLMSNT